MINNILELYKVKELILLSYLLIINVFAFTLMAIDKYKAKKNKWRIQEKTYFIIAFIGGAVGAVMGMVVFRHKTQHKTFYVGIPIIYLVNKIILEIIMVRIIK